MTKKNYIIVSIILIIAVLISFFAGVSYGKTVNNSKTRLSQSNGFDMQNRMQRNGGGFNGNGEGKGMFQNKMISGEVISNDGKILTIKLRDGGSKIVFVSATTKIDKTVEAKIDDLSTGKNIMISGDINQDGSVTANAIQVRPFIQGGLQREGSK